MKKNLTFIVLSFLFLLFPFLSVEALTKVNFQQTSNGAIKTTINFDEGFVGGIDLVLKISDTVQFKSFDFNKDFVNKNFTRDVKYDSNKHTIHIIVTSGGIGSSHNVLDSKRNLVLGTLNLTTTSKKNVDYTIGYESLDYINNGWKLQNIAKDDLVLEESNKFTYTVTTTEQPTDPGEQKPDDNPETNPNTPSEGDTGNTETKPSEETNKPSDGSSENNNNNNNNTSTSTVTKPTTGTGNNKEENTNDDKLDTDENLDTDDDLENKNDQEENTEPDKETNNNDKENKKINKAMIIIISVIVVLLIISLFILFSVRDSKNKLEI